MNGFEGSPENLDYKMNHDFFFLNTVSMHRIPNQPTRYHESNKGDSVPKIWFQNKSKSHPQNSIKRNYIKFCTSWHILVIQ